MANRQNSVTGHVVIGAEQPLSISASLSSIIVVLLVQVQLRKPNPKPQTGDDRLRSPLLHHPQGHHQMPVRFCVLTMPRSGSTYLLSLLNSHPAVGAFEELFLMRRIREDMRWVAEGSPERFFEYRQLTRWPRPFSVFRYLAMVHAFDAEREAVGFKLMVAQARFFPEILPFLCIQRYRIILLVRTNVFEGCVSAYLSAAPGSGHSRFAPVLDPLEVDPHRLVADMRRRQRHLECLDQWLPMLPMPSMKVEYERLRVNPIAECRRIFHFLGITDEATVASGLKKRVIKPYRQLILNYAEIEQALAEAGLANHLVPRSTAP